MSRRSSLLILFAVSFLAAGSISVGIDTTTTNTTAEPAPQETTPVDSISWDYHAATARALADLAAYVESTTTTTVVRRAAVVSSPVDDSVWDRLAVCETGGRWNANTGNGYGGGVQFAHGPGWSTWRAFGGTEFTADPWDATREQQIVVAERVLARSGWGAWPGCARRYGWL